VEEVDRSGRGGCDQRERCCWFLGCLNLSSMRMMAP